MTFPTDVLADLDPSNPLRAPSELPYELPDFAQLRTDHLVPAAQSAMAVQRAAIAAIASDTQAPTAANVLDPWEASGRALSRVLHIVHTLVSADANDALNAVEIELSGQLAAHQDAVLMDAGFIGRLRALRTAADAGQTTLEPDQDYLLTTLLRDARRAGADLTAADQETLRDLNQRLSTLQSQFGRTLLAAQNAGAVLLTDPAELAGLPDDLVAGARAAAQRAGHDTGWLIELRLPTSQPILASLDNPDVRQRVHTASVTRGLSGEHDTRGLLVQIAQLRAQRAALLGYPHHAAYIAEEETAATSEAIGDFLARVVPPAVANANREAAELGVTRACDWPYAAAHTSHDDADTGPDDADLRPYLEIQRVVFDGVFYAAHELFGISFQERTDLAAYHPDVRVFEVFDSPEPGEPNTGMGLYLADWYARPSKRGGAWMNTLIDQNHLLAQRPIVLNTLNITQPPAGSPTLLTWDEVTTLFHEFGHALHGLFSDVRYPSQSGPSVPRDFVEYPSQVNEMWAWEPRILRHFARHHVTGEPLPEEWVEKLAGSRQEGQGFATAEYLGATMLDQAWHRLSADEVPADPADVESFESAALSAAGISLPLVPPRYRSSYFNHIFAGGYSAAYYAYLWSEALDADTVEWYRENGGLSRENGERFRRVLLAFGGSRDPLESFRQLRGRDVELTALLERRGLLQ